MVGNGGVGGEGRNSTASKRQGGTVSNKTRTGRASSTNAPDIPRQDTIGFIYFYRVPLSAHTILFHLLRRVHLLSHFCSSTPLHSLRDRFTTEAVLYGEEDRCEWKLGGDKTRGVLQRGMELRLQSSHASIEQGFKIIIYRKLAMIGGERGN